MQNSILYNGKPWQNKYNNLEIFIFVVKFISTFLVISLFDLYNYNKIYQHIRDKRLHCNSQILHYGV